MSGWLFIPLLITMSAFYAGGGYYLSLCAKDNAGLAALGVSFTLYGLGNLAYLLVIKSYGYGMAVMLSGVAVTIVNLSIAVVIMGERFSKLQLLGAAIAIIGVALVMAPRGGTAI